MSGSLKKKLIIGLALGFLVYVAFAFFADLGELLRAGGTFPWLIFPLICLLSVGNYLVRLFRWNYYLKKLEIPLGGRESAIIFFAGLVMSITPGKFGELLKSQYIKNINGTARRHSGPVVLAERLTDLIGVLVLASFGIFRFNYGEVIFFVVLGMIVVSLAIVSSRKLCLGLLALASKIPIVGRVAYKLEEAYENMSALLRPAALFNSTLMSILAWGCESLGFYFVINAFPGISLSYTDALFIYAFATIVGAVTMLPGGLGITEGTMTGLMVLLNIPTAVAVASTLITRLATLWFAVFIGLIATVVWRRLLEGEVAPETDGSGTQSGPS
ncbi:MAG TPA: lysylphosphatidylglycerol synthase transmembrane domain-containing protein [Acidobacteriota bacterium]|nr:lysylphosphatidylglycerol synthase transmembrane domain-containing protein [Acidobacteriota bacterium]